LISIKEGMILWNVKSENIEGVFSDKYSINILTKSSTKSFPGRIAMVPCLEEAKREVLLSKLTDYKEIIDGVQ